MEDTVINSIVHTLGQFSLEVQERSGIKDRAQRQQTEQINTSLQHINVQMNYLVGMPSDDNVLQKSHKLLKKAYDMFHESRTETGSFISCCFGSQDKEDSFADILKILYIILEHINGVKVQAEGDHANLSTQETDRTNHTDRLQSDATISDNNLSFALNYSIQSTPGTKLNQSTPNFDIIILKNETARKLFAKYYSNVTRVDIPELIENLKSEKYNFSAEKVASAAREKYRTSSLSLAQFDEFFDMVFAKQIQPLGKLVVIHNSKNYINKVIRLEKYSMIFGTSAKYCDFVVSNSTHELFQARLEHENGKFYLHEEGYASQTMVYIQPKVPVKITSSTTMTLGKTNSIRAQSIQKTDSNGDSNPKLVINVNKKREKLQFHAKDVQKITVGRESTGRDNVPHISINDGSVSPVHGTFEFLKGDWYYKDNQSSQGSWLWINQFNPQECQYTSCPVEIRNNDVFRIGSSIFRYKNKL